MAAGSARREAQGSGATSAGTLSPEWGGRHLLISMPLFEFTCRDCGHRFEQLVLGSRRAACPQCESKDLEKQYSTFGTAGSGTKAKALSRFT